MPQLLAKGKRIGSTGRRFTHAHSGCLRMPGQGKPAALIQGSQGKGNGMTIALIDLLQSRRKPGFAQLSTDRLKGGVVNRLHSSLGYKLG